MANKYQNFLIAKSNCKVVTWSSAIVGIIQEFLGILPPYLGFFFFPNIPSLITDHSYIITVKIKVLCSFLQSGLWYFRLTAIAFNFLNCLRVNCFHLLTLQLVVKLLQSVQLTYNSTASRPLQLTKWFHKCNSHIAHIHFRTWTCSQNCKHT